MQYFNYLHQNMFYNIFHKILCLRHYNFTFYVLKKCMFNTVSTYATPVLLVAV